jgi:hypothetical protein
MQNSRIWGCRTVLQLTVSLFLRREFFEVFLIYSLAVPLLWSQWSWFRPVWFRFVPACTETCWTIMEMAAFKSCDYLVRHTQAIHCNHEFVLLVRSFCVSLWHDGTFIAMNSFCVRIIINVSSVHFHVYLVSFWLRYWFVDYVAPLWKLAFTCTGC